MALDATCAVRTERPAPAPGPGIIAKLFRLAHLSENLGYGLRKLKGWQEVTGMPMRIENTINSVKVILDLKCKDTGTADDAKNDAKDVGVNVGVNYDDLTDLQKSILQIVKLSPSVTAKELSVQMS